MERLKIRPSVSARKTLENGTSISVKKIEEIRPLPNKTAEHEAAHVVASGEIVNASIIPSGDALGTTRPVRMTAVAAAAAAALGFEGTGWDQFITEQVLGVDFRTAKAAARSVLSGKEDEMYEIATILQERSTIDQYDVNLARKNVAERRQGIFPVEVVIDRSGTVYSYTTNTFHGEVIVNID